MIGDILPFESGREKDESGEFRTSRIINRTPQEHRNAFLDIGEKSGLMIFNTKIWRNKFAGKRGKPGESRDVSPFRRPGSSLFKSHAAKQYEIVVCQSTSFSFFNSKIAFENPGKLT
jgi:hypothetical protein